MSYQEIISKLLKEKKASQLARQWEMGEMTLGRYLKGSRLPDYLTAKKMAEEAGISSGEMLEILAQEELTRKPKTEKISKSFNWLLRIANVRLVRVPATA